MSTLRAKGARLDPAGMPRTGLHVLAAKAKWEIPRITKAGTVLFPLALSLAPYITDASKGGVGIPNQNDAGACTGCAKGGSINARLAVMGKPIKKLSITGIYNASLRLARLPNADGTVSKLEDDGVASNVATRAVQEWGACSALAYDNDAPISSAGCLVEPTERQLDLTSQFQVLGSYGFTSSGDQRAIDRMTALLNGYFVEETLYADTAFESYVGGILTVPSNWQDPNPATGWHRNYACGFAWDGTNLSSVVFQYANSWGGIPGQGWGEPNVLGGSSSDSVGFYRASRAWTDQLQDQNVQNISTNGVEA